MDTIIVLKATVGRDMHGKRLDQALALLAPDAGLRQRKRLWLTHEVLVDGRPRPKGYIVRQGQELRLAPLDAPAPEALVHGPYINEPYVVARQGEFVALFKPAGLPTAAIAGKPGPSLEKLLPALLPDANAQLLNRLDTPTSGLVLVALTHAALKQYAAHQDAGLTRKTYLALVRGRVAGAMTLDRHLDTANRKTARVLDQTAEPLRRTSVQGLHWFEQVDLSLVAAEIAKGARHQIRAHLAHAGHPIVGDGQYGGNQEGGLLYLHHMRIKMPGFSALALPQWPLPVMFRNPDSA